MLQLVFNLLDASLTPLASLAFGSSDTSARANKAAVSQLRTASHAAAPHTLEALSKADQRAFACRRLVMLAINEAAWCLTEGRAESPAAVDLALMLAGWAPHRGGPLRYARHVGIDRVGKDVLDGAVLTNAAF